MSSQADTCAFPRGKTFYDGTTIDVSSSYANVGGIGLEGQVHYFPCTAAETTGRPRRDQTLVKALCVRNVSGVALLPSRRVVFKAGSEGKRVDGYARTTYDNVRLTGVVDDHLPSTGVPDGDLFWLIRGGKCLVKTTHAADGGNVLVVGDRVVGATAANSTATTASGCVELQVLTGATAILASQIQNAIGIALTARTTANTNRSTLNDLIEM